MYLASGFVIYNPKNPIRRESLQGKVQSELQQQSSAQTNRRAHLNGNENQDKNYHFLGKTFQVDKLIFIIVFVSTFQDQEKFLWDKSKI